MTKLGLNTLSNGNTSLNAFLGCGAALNTGFTGVGIDLDTVLLTAVLAAVWPGVVMPEDSLSRLFDKPLKLPIFVPNSAIIRYD